MWNDLLCDFGDKRGRFSLNLEDECSPTFTHSSFRPAPFRHLFSHLSHPAVTICQHTFYTSYPTAREVLLFIHARNDLWMPHAASLSLYATYQQHYDTVTLPTTRDRNPCSAFGSFTTAAPIISPLTHLSESECFSYLGTITNLFVLSKCSFCNHNFHIYRSAPFVIAATTMSYFSHLQLSAVDKRLPA